MDSLISAFGIDLKLIIIQVINFVVLAAALSYLLYKPVLKLLNEREEKIKQGMADAEAAGKAKENAEAERKEIVGAAHQEAEAVGKRASEHAKEIGDNIVRYAEEKAAASIEAAREKGEALKQQAQKDSEAEIAKLAVLAAERILKEKS